MKTFPPVGGCRPVTTLKSVVLPAPLGPMRPVTWACSASMSTPLSAWMPPKRTSTSLTRNTGKAVHLQSSHVVVDRDRRRVVGGALGFVAIPQRADDADQPVREEAERHRDQACDEVLQVGG